MIYSVMAFKYQKDFPSFENNYFHDKMENTAINERFLNHNQDSYFFFFNGFINAVLTERPMVR